MIDIVFVLDIVIVVVVVIVENISSDQIDIQMFSVLPSFELVVFVVCLGRWRSSFSFCFGLLLLFSSVGGVGSC